MNKGLGLFSGIKGWIKRNLHIISAVCVALGLPEISAGLEFIHAQGGMDNWKISTGSLDQQSADILDDWDTNKFVPFYTELLHSLKNNVLAINSKDKKIRAQFANEILLKIAAVKQYYIFNDNEGLSNDAILNRLNYLDETLNLIIDQIFSPNELKPTLPIFQVITFYQQIQITQNFKSINLGILQLPVANDFNVTTTVFNISNNVSVLTPSPATVASNPTPTVEDIKNVIASAGGSTVGITSTNTNTNTPTPIQTSTVTKALGFLLIAIGLLSPSKNSLIKNQ